MSRFTRSGVRVAGTAGAVVLALTSLGCHNAGGGEGLPAPEPSEFTGLGGNWMDDSYAGGPFTFWLDWEIESAGSSGTEEEVVAYVGGWSPGAIRDALVAAWTASGHPKTEIIPLGGAGDGAFLCRGRVSGVKVTAIHVSDKNNVKTKVDPNDCVVVKWSIGDLDLSGLKLCR